MTCKIIFDVQSFFDASKGTIDFSMLFRGYAIEKWAKDIMNEFECLQHNEQYDDLSSPYTTNASFIDILRAWPWVVKSSNS